MTSKPTIRPECGIVKNYNDEAGDQIEVYERIEVADQQYVRTQKELNDKQSEFKYVRRPLLSKKPAK